jgi:hypothetical protein
MATDTAAAATATTATPARVLPTSSSRGFAEGEPGVASDSANGETGVCSAAALSVLAYADAYCVASGSFGVWTSS